MLAATMPTASPETPDPLAGAVRDGAAARWAALGWAVLIPVAVALCFRGALDNGWVEYDDDTYVTGNPRVEAFTAENLRWMWTDTGTFYWQPLAWMWHAALRALLGTAPGPHHAAGIVLHAAGALAAAALVLALLPRGEDGRASPSLRIAAAGAAGLLWGVHPLRAEAVAWVAGQKELLSTLFMLLATLSWLGRTGSRPRTAWTLSLVFTGLALLVKPMAIMLPAVFLVLDVVPLRRLRGAADLPGLLREKVPHVLLAVAALLPSVLDPRQENLLPTGEGVRLADRLPAVAWGTAFPLIRSVWPTGLSPFHAAPLPGHAAGPGAGSLVGTLVLLGVTAAAILRARRGGPGPLAAWVAYVLLVLPVSGLRQAGAVATADRFAQAPTLALLPLVGALLLDAAMELRDAKWSAGGAAAALAAGSLAVGSALGSLTAGYVGAWRDPGTLWSRVLASGGPPHPIPFQNLGAVLLARGMQGGDPTDLDRARALFEEALRLDPRHASTLNNMGLLAAHGGRDAEAEEYYLRAEAVDPRSPLAPANLALLLARRGRADEGRAAWRRARARPGPLPTSLETRLREALGAPGEGDR